MLRASLAEYVMAAHLLPVAEIADLKRGLCVMRSGIRICGILYNEVVRKECRSDRE